MVSPLRRQRDTNRKESTHNALVMAAIDIFGEKGYHRALISDIVARAGVGQGTFYRNFKNKRQIIDTIMDHFSELLLNQFESMSVNLPADLGEYQDSSRHAVLAMARLVEQNRNLALLLLREAPTVDRDFESRVNTLFDQFAELAAFYLDYAVSKGYARPCNTRIVAQAIVGMGIRHMSIWLCDPKAVDINELITELVDFAFLGMGAHPQQG